MSEQLLNKLDNIQEIERYLQDTLRSFIDMRDVEQPYYGFISLTDKWNEYDRCYELRAIPKVERENHQYDGYSNIMLPDFHDRIEILRTREVNALFSGADQFQTKPTKVSTEEDAIMAKKLVKYNFNCLPNFRDEVSMIIRDKLIYGSWVAYCPWIEDEERVKDVRSDMIDEEGQIFTMDGVPQQEQKREVYNVYPKKYTGLEQVDLKTVYLHPRIANIQDQVAVYISITYSYDELLQLEADGMIEEGMADTIKDEYSDYYLDDDAERSLDRLSNDETERDDEIQAFDLYLCYWKYGSGDDRKIYEGIFWNDHQLAGIREYEKEKYPLLMGSHIKVPRSAYGIGVGDEIYPTYMAKNDRINMVNDLTAFEILGGGLIDSHKIPEFKGMRPGIFKKVPGLAAMQQAGGSPILSWGQIRGARASDAGLNVIGFFNEALQSGSGATSLLSGMPSQSPVDKTASGIEMSIKESNARINTYLEDFETQFMKGYAMLCFSNYQEYIVPKRDLKYMLDPEDMYYTDKQGQKVPLKLSDVIMNVDFVFTATKRIVDAEKQIGKFTRFLSILGQVGAVNPPLGQAMTQAVDFKFLIEELAKSLEIADLDLLFPDFNVMQELLNAQQSLQQATMQAQQMEQGIQLAVQKLDEQGNASAIDTIGKVMRGETPEQQEAAKQQPQQGAA